MNLTPDEREEILAAYVEICRQMVLKNPFRATIPAPLAVSDPAEYAKQRRDEVNMAILAKLDTWERISTVVAQYRLEASTTLPADDAGLMAELEAIRCRLFDLANSKAGNDKGNAACLLHAAASEICRALRCLERGNPANEPIPPHLLAQSLGMFNPQL